MRSIKKHEHVGKYIYKEIRGWGKETTTKTTKKQESNKKKKKKKKKKEERNRHTVFT